MVLEDWEFVTILPNINISKSYNKIAMVNSEDSRIQYLKENNKVIGNLINCVIDNKGKNIEPSSLIIHKDLTEHENFNELIIGFRNIIAIFYICKGWLQTVSGKTDNVSSTLYSDFYDLAPINIIKDKWFNIYSPALNSMFNNVKDFKIQRNIQLPRDTILYPSVETNIFNSLLSTWHKTYLKNNINHKKRALFRSLQMAYRACKLPSDNLSNVYDYGTKIGLWISAFEILFHPGGNEYVYCEKVINNLKKYIKIKENIFKKQCENDDNNEFKSKIIGKIYKDIYDARNNFLHGNKLEENIMYPFNDSEKPPLSYLAPIIYLIGIFVFLNENNLFIDVESKSNFTKSLVDFHTHHEINKVLEKFSDVKN